MFHVVLYQPEIPPNTGAIGRLCLSAGAQLHLIHPLGFSLDEQKLRRAGLDYWENVDLHEWDSFAHLQNHALAQDPAARFFYLSTKGKKCFWDAELRSGDYLVFGPETRGLPERLLKENENRALTIPMPGENARSLNLATAVGIVLWEALRQARPS